MRISQNQWLFGLGWSFAHPAVAASLVTLNFELLKGFHSRQPLEPLLCWIWPLPSLSSQYCRCMELAVYKSIDTHMTRFSCQVRPSHTRRLLSFCSELSFNVHWRGLSIRSKLLAFLYLRYALSLWTFFGMDCTGKSPNFYPSLPWLLPSCSSLLLPRFSVTQ